MTWGAAIVYADASYDAAARLCGWAAWHRDIKGNDTHESGVVRDVERSTTAEAIALSSGLELAASASKLGAHDVLFGLSDCLRAVAIANGQTHGLHGAEIVLVRTVLALRRQGIIVQAYYVRGHQGRTIGEQVNKWCDLTAKAAVTRARVSAVL